MVMHPWFEELVEAITNKQALAYEREVNASLNTSLTTLESEKELLSQKLTLANSIIYQCNKDDVQKAQRIAELEILNKSLFSEMDNLNLSIEGLKYDLALYGDVDVKCPTFIDESKPPYLPYIQTVNPDGTIGGFQITNPKDLYSISDFQRRLTKDWRKLPEQQKLMNVWSNTINAFKYEYDWGDNWQPPLFSYYRKKADCDDGSIYFTTMCRAVGISPDRVFLAVGPTNFGYHAYPIVQHSDLRWYIYETTIDYTPNAPIPLRTSPYWIDNGLQNWKFAGQVRPEKMNELKDTSSKGLLTGKIDNSKTKREKIIEYWRSLDG